MMNDDSKLESAQSAKAGPESGKASSDFFVGLLTFIVFIIFMTAWMYFGAAD